MKRIVLLLISIVLLSNMAFSQSAKEMVQRNAASKDYNTAAGYIQQALTENKKDFDFMILAGDIYSELENLDSALLMYKKADELESDQPLILRKLAKTYSGLKKHDEAIEAAKDAIKEEKDNVYNYLALGQVYLAADSINQAELFITKAREINKKNPDAYIALGDLYFARRVYELAKNNYEEALSIDESNLEARTKLAISYYWLANREYDEDLANGLFTKSLQEWNTITKQDPKNARAFFEQGKILFYSKIWDKAAKSLYEYVQLRPAGSLGRWFLAQSLYELAQCDSAGPHLEICAEQIDSVKNKALLLLARCYFDAKQYEKSISTFDRLKLSDTLDISDLERYGAAAFQLGDTVKAIGIYQEVITKDPSKCKLIFKTAVMLSVLEKYKESIELMQKRIDKCDDEFTNKTFFYIGISYLKSEDAESSKYYFKKSFEKDSTDFLSLIYLSDAYAKLEQDDSASYYLDIVISKTLNDTVNFGWLVGNAYAKQCNLYYKAKNYLKLKNVASEWIKFKVETPIAYLYIATYYQIEQNMDMACSNYKLVIKYDDTKKLAPIAKEQISKLSCK